MRRIVVTAREMTEIFGVCLNTVYRGLRSGQIPSVRLGRRYLVSREGLEAFLRDGSARPRPLRQRRPASLSRSRGMSIREPRGKAE